MSAPTRGRRRTVDLLPMLSLALSAVVAAVVLPSALRPPPEQQSASSAFSPDAPPEEEADAIVQSLRQAASRTAGASGAEPTPVTTVPKVEKPSRGQCFGDPPRQVESLYAAPCRAAFTGDNGGATHKNVSGDEVRVAMWHGLISASEGTIPDAPPPGEGAAMRTLRILQAYFNKNYELYGRRLQIVWMDPADDEEATHRATAVRADEEWGVFASIYLSSPYCDEMARRTLISFCDNFASSFYPPRDPYVWSLMPDLGKTDRLGAEYVCKKLIGRKAAFAGDPAYQQMERRVGVLAESDPVVSGDHTSADIARALREQCGYEAVTTIDFNVRNEQGVQQLTTGIAKLRQENVTTVFGSARGGSWAVFMALADSAGYSPEWFQPGQYAVDWNSFTQILPPSQSAHLFGLGVHEIARPLDETDCYRAYRSIDPSSSPDRQTCLLFFHDLMSVANGLQEAGPKLTPESFRDGLYSMGTRLYPNEEWAMGGGFSRGDWTYIDSAAEIWWDPNAVDPEQGRPGAYRWTNNGRRYLPGEIPEGEPLVFTDPGITRPQ